MMKTLARHVHVRHPADGEMHVFAPGEQVPEWAHELITNPKAWGDDGSPPVEEFYAAQTGVAPPPDEAEATAPPPAAVNAPAGQGPPDGDETAAPAKGARRVGAQNRTPRA